MLATVTVRVVCGGAHHLSRPLPPVTDLSVRPAQQSRSRESWAKVLDASHALRDVFVGLLGPTGSGMDDSVVAAFFQSLFGALVLRTGFGPGFAADAGTSDGDFVAGLQHLAVRSLLDG